MEKNNDPRIILWLNVGKRAGSMNQQRFILWVTEKILVLIVIIDMGGS